MENFKASNSSRALVFSNSQWLYFVLLSSIAVALRLIAFLTNFHSYFLLQKEIVTPITNFPSIKEGILLKQLHGSPYIGNIYHQSPLLVELFEFFVNNDFANFLLFVALDIINGFFLFQISKLKKANEPNSLIPNPNIIVALYLFNPLTILSNLGMSTLIFSSFGIFFSLYFSMLGNILLSNFGLALAVHFSVYPLILLFPLSLISKKSLFINSIFLILWSIILLVACYTLTGSWIFVSETYGFAYFVPDLSPNIGLFWYFLTEVFKYFSNFFLFAFQYHTFLYAIPLYIRLWRHPFFLLWFELALLATFKAYPAVGDVALHVAIIPLILLELKGTIYGVLIVIVALFSGVLAPIFWSMWIYKGTGNANFYYAINLVIAVAQIIFMSDAISNILKNDYFEKKRLKESKKE